MAAGSLFASLRTGAQNLFTQAADGTGAATQLTESPNTQRPTSLSPDGTRLVFYENNPKTDWDVMQLRLDGTHEITPLVQTPFAERNGEDLAATAAGWRTRRTTRGRSKSTCSRFPTSPVARRLVSTGGGTQPLWAQEQPRAVLLRAERCADGRRAWDGGRRGPPRMPVKLLEAALLYRHDRTGRSDATTSPPTVSGF